MSCAQVAAPWGKSAVQAALPGEGPQDLGVGMPLLQNLAGRMMASFPKSGNGAKIPSSQSGSREMMSSLKPDGRASTGVQAAQSAFGGSSGMKASLSVTLLTTGGCSGVEAPLSASGKCFGAKASLSDSLTATGGSAGAKVSLWLFC